MHAGAAKAAIDAMTRHLAVEWGPQNIRINSIAPGPIEGTVGMSKLGEVIEIQRLARGTGRHVYKRKQVAKQTNLLS